MKIVVQSFNIENNIWYKNLILQLINCSFDIIVVVSSSSSENIMHFGKITYIFTPDNLFEFVSFKKIHQYLNHPFIFDDIYLFIHDTCILGNLFDSKLSALYNILKLKSFHYAPIGINRKNAKHYTNKFKTKFNICFCSSNFMLNNNFDTFFSTPFSKKIAVQIELGDHNFSFRKWPDVIIDNSCISQIIQDKKFKVFFGAKRLKNFIPILDLYKYVSTAFLKS